MEIITITEAKTLGRPIGAKVGDAKIAAYIREVEQTVIRQGLGDSLFLKIKETDSLEAGESIVKLLEGGIYNDKCGNKRTFAGLKVTAAYYVYAANVMSGDFESTRYGMVLKDGAYSTGISSKERSDIYNSVIEIANSYMKDCIYYSRQAGLLDCGCTSGNKTAFGGLTIRKIGR